MYLITPPNAAVSHFPVLGLNLVFAGVFAAARALANAIFAAAKASSSAFLPATIAAPAPIKVSLIVTPVETNPEIPFLLSPAQASFRPVINCKEFIPARLVLSINPDKPFFPSLFVTSTNDLLNSSAVIDAIFCDLPKLSTSDCAFIPNSFERFVIDSGLLISKPIDWPK